MKETISKKMKEASVLLIAVVMVLSTVAVTADTNDNRAVISLTSTKGSNHMIFGNERIFSNGETLLWDNGDPDGILGLSSCYWSSYPIDREVVDDFDINETSWVGGGHFRMVTYAGNNANFIDGVNVFFYEDIGNEPSVDRYAERVAEFDAYNTGDDYFGRPEIAINVSFDTIELATGKWWVCFQPVLEDNGFWLTATGYGESVWGSLPDGGYPKWTKGYIIYGGYYDMSFKLFRSSPPPEKPQRPYGPTEGVNGVEYMFSTSTTDPPEGEQVCYLWDWDDETPTKWTDFYDSGVTVYANHIWTEIGEYNITVKAKDLDGGESEWSDPKTIYIVDVPILEIDTITGTLFKIRTIIKNIGGIDATRVNWSITLDGGIIFLGKETSGIILNLPAGDEAMIRSSLILGFGKTVITVTAECDESSDATERDAFVFLFFIL